MDSSLLYGPVNISDPSQGCPIIVAAGRVRNPRQGDDTPYFVSGSGTTFEEAARRCIDEADETYLAQIVPKERILRSSADAISDRIVEPSAILLLGEEQVEREASTRDANHRVAPTRWRKSTPEDWIMSDRSLGTGEAWVPAPLSFIGYPAESEETSLPPADSNGLALGYDPEDAARRALLELVERDATAIWWYNRLILPRIDPASLAIETISAYAEWLRHQGRELRLLRLTLDLPIPVVAAISSRLGRRPAMGFAADLTAPEAARRAVGELAQCEANLALLERQAKKQGTTGFSRDAAQLYRWHHQIDLELFPHLKGAESGPTPAADMTLDYSACLNICRRKDLDVFAVILSRDNRRSLVRTFVPGLRSTKPRLGPGRLYTVASTLGLRPESPNRIYPEPFPF